MTLTMFVLIITVIGGIISIVVGIMTSIKLFFELRDHRQEEQEPPLQHS